MVLDNRFFLRIQPWSSTAILSGLEGGVGYTLLSHYYFLPDYYTGGLDKQWHNAAYAYAGAYGMLKKYFAPGTGRRPRPGRRCLYVKYWKLDLKMCRNMTDAIIMDYLKIARERGSRPGVGPGLLERRGAR